jgi:DNA-binding response OmpR family regulator
MRILVVEDDPEAAASMRAMLGRARFAVHVETDGQAGLEALLSGTFDAAVLDIDLPTRDGFGICRAARAESIDTPVLVVTARHAVEDRVRALDAGADDYLIAPFAEAEFAARLRALLRRGCRPVRERLTAGELVVDHGARTVTVAGRPLAFASTEFRVIEYLAINANIAISRTQMLERVWGDRFDGEPNIVDVYVSSIRRKLQRAGVQRCIETVWGVGYRLVA